MSASTDELFSKFKDDKNKTYFILIKWQNEEDMESYLDLTLTDASNTWKLSYKKYILEKKSNLKVFDLNQIKEEINNAFKYNSISKANYVINITFDDSYSLAKVIIRKKIDNDISVEVTRLELNIVDDPSIENQTIFNYSLEYISKLENNLSFLKQDSQRLSDERNEAFKEYERCIDEKIKIENDLYSKFVLVLNEKKKKIKELKDEIETLNRDGVVIRDKDDIEDKNEESNDGQLIKINKKTKAKADKSDDEEVATSVAKPILKVTKKANLAANESLCLNLNEDESPSKSKGLSLSQKRKLRKKESSTNLNEKEDKSATKNDSNKNDNDYNDEDDEFSTVKKTTFSQKTRNNTTNKNSISSTLNVEDLIDKI